LLLQLSHLLPRRLVATRSLFREIGHLPLTRLFGSNTWLLGRLLRRLISLV
jgi:hypothetical protein